MEAWTTIRYLRAQGKTIRAIARELGLSRNTVRAALREENPPTYTRLPRANRKLAPFLAQIEEMVVGQKFIGSRILRELRALGYQGGPAAFPRRGALNALSFSSTSWAKIASQEAMVGGGIHPVLITSEK